MGASGRGRCVAIGLLVLAVLAAVATLVSSVALYRGYRPSAPSTDPLLYAPDTSSSLAWLDRERAATIVLILLSVLAAVASLVMLVARRRWAWGVALVGSLAAATGAVASLATRAAVQWDQLALWAVTVGTDMKGYEAATKTPVVRFIIINEFFFSTIKRQFSAQAIRYIPQLGEHTGAVADFNVTGQVFFFT